MPGTVGGMHALAETKYIALTTFTRDGRPKTTPVWIAADGDGLIFYTGADSWKVRRLRNTPIVEARESDMRGRVDPYTVVYRGTAELLADDASIERAGALIGEKYGVQATAVRALDTVKGWFGKGETPIAVRLVVTAD